MVYNSLTKGGIAMGIRREIEDKFYQVRTSAAGERIVSGYHLDIFMGVQVELVVEPPRWQDHSGKDFDLFHGVGYLTVGTCRICDCQISLRRKIGDCFLLFIDNIQNIQPVSFAIDGVVVNNSEVKKWAFLTYLKRLKGSIYQVNGI